MPWLTPDSIPEGDDCRPLLIPADSVWLALVSGALTELTQKYNWQQFGSLTVQETVDKMQEIIDNYYDAPCGGCELPEGGKIIRIGAHGKTQELGDDGTWQEPTGDYAIPAPGAREGGTAPDQNCLAAKNAVNVLQQLYDSLNSSWNSNLSEAEAGTAFILAAGAVIGFEFAPLTLSIVGFLAGVFTVLYEALAYLGADLWDTNFSKQLECFLLDCASNDAGVVTFDWDCLMGKLNSLTDSFGLSEVQLRLYLQVTFILYFIGGVDGLNLAGTTTDITNDDCSFCELEWCYTFDFTLSDGGFSVLTGAPGAYSAGVGWIGTYVNSLNTSSMRIALDLTTTTITQYQVDYSVGSGGTMDGMGFVRLRNAGVTVFTGSVNGNPGTYTKHFDVGGDADAVWFGSDADAAQTVTRVTLHGTGTNPFGDDNCV